VISLAGEMGRHLARSTRTRQVKPEGISRHPIVGTSKLKDCIRLLFRSGQSFDEPGLEAEGSFKAAEDPVGLQEHLEAQRANSSD
jgi:hypothetical protein